MEELKCLCSNFPWYVFLFWLLPLLLLLWWLWSRISRLTDENKTLSDQIFELEKEKNGLDVELKHLKSTLSLCKDEVQTLKTKLKVGGSSLKSVTPDNLKIVEGIGEKIEKILNSKEIYTFAQLAATKPEIIKSYLEEAGKQYNIHDPSTWADQAALARDGKMDDLKKWQDLLNKGKIE